MYKRGLKLWSCNTDFYYEEAKKLYNQGIFDYIELYVVPETLETLPKWKELRTLSICDKEQGERYSQTPSPLVGEGWGEGYKKATHFYTKQALEYSKELRKNQTDAEKILWYYLRNRQLNNMKFRRQEAIGSYVADFVCYENKLIIELDGGGHIEPKQAEHDNKRDAFLNKNGFKVIRIYNTEVYKNIEGVLEYILNSVKVDPSPLTPLPQGARETACIDTPDLTTLSQGAGKTGIPFIIHNAHFAQGFNLAKQEKTERNREIYEQTKQFADELNAEYIIFHGGIDGDIRETAIQLALFNEPRAIIENKPFVALPGTMGGKFCRGYNIDEIKLVMDTAGCGFCLDFGHAICAANSLKLDVYKYCNDFLQLKPNMYHLTDLKDITSPYDSHLHLGTGQLDFNKIFTMIPNNSYITFETIKSSKENLDDFAQDMKFINNYEIS